MSFCHLFSAVLMAISDKKCNKPSYFNITEVRSLILLKNQFAYCPSTKFNLFLKFFSDILEDKKHIKRCNDSEQNIQRLLIKDQTSDKYAHDWCIAECGTGLYLFLIFGCHIYFAVIL